MELKLLPFCQISVQYVFIEEMYGKYRLQDVYNLVYFERDSKYITNIVKPLVADHIIVHDVEMKGMFRIEELKLRQQHVNLGDEVLLTDEKRTKILTDHIYEISGIKKVNSNLEVQVVQKEKINRAGESEILEQFEEA